MNDVGQFAWSHALVLVFSTVAAVVSRALHDNSALLPVSWPTSTRMTILATLTALSTALDQVVNGGDWHMAIVTAAVTGLPGIVVELIQWLGGKKGPPGGTGTIDLVAEEKKRSAPPYSTKMVMLPLLASLVVLPGCSFLKSTAATVSPVLSDVAVYIADAQQVVEIAKITADLFFTANPSPDARASVDKVFLKVHSALDAAIFAVRGAKDLTDLQLDAAFASFRSAWLELQTIFGKTGILAGDGKLAASKEPMRMPLVVKERH